MTQLCPKCNGEGKIPGNPLSSATYEVCPVCLGKMIVNSFDEAAAREDEAVGFRIWCDENHWVMVAHDLYASIYNQDFGTAEYNAISLKELYKQYKARFTNNNTARFTNNNTAQ